VLAERILQALEDPAGISWIHRLPSEAPVEREDFLLELAQGKRVAHLGFVDEHLLEAKVAHGRWLHARLAGTASELVGIDIEPEGVEWARARGYEAFVADCQDSRALAELPIERVEVVVAGEIIEHLEAPGAFLRACHALVERDVRIVVTTPNAAALQNFLAPIFGVELIHPDHLALFSPRTLRVLFERTGWEVERIAYYQRPAPVGRAQTLSGKALMLARRGIAAALRLRPYWADGIVVVGRSRA
jgi:SAM-dependent methyltransferase